MISLSDTVAWPAGILYDKTLSVHVESGYNRAMGDPKVDQAVKEKQANLAKAYDGDFADFDFHFDISETLESYPDYAAIDFLSTTTEYAIYVGVCLAWAMAIGVLDFITTVLVITEKREKGSVT